MKATALFSGGLDSLLAIKIIQLQSIKIIPVTFKSYFFNSRKAKKYAELNDLKAEVVDISHNHYKIVNNPRYGYGSGMNPCIDCHALMIREAYEFSKDKGSEFLITGDVLFQRPFSQTRDGINNIDGLTGLGDVTLRPLSARLLKPTKPERNGIVDRDKLYGISGRSRKVQMELAREFGIKHFSSPAGGCILTDVSIGTRLNYLMKLCGMTESMVEIVKIGRHFVLNNSIFIVTRNKKETELLINMDVEIFDVPDKKGPVGFLIKCNDDFKGQDEVEIEDDELFASKILSRYYSGNTSKVITSRDKVMEVEPLGKFETDKLIIK